MKAGKKSWKAKLDKPALPEICEGPEQWSARYGGHRMLIATPRLIEVVVQGIPKGEVMRMGALRARLAEMEGADYTCPLTTGIFARIVAEASEEAREEGRMGDVSPWWRLVPDDGKLNAKLPGGGKLQGELLAEEGQKCQEKSGKWRVESGK